MEAWLQSTVYTALTRNSPWVFKPIIEEVADVGSVSRETLAGLVSRETSRQGSVLNVAASSNWLIRGEGGGRSGASFGSLSAIAGRTGFDAPAGCWRYETRQWIRMAAQGRVGRVSRETTRLKGHRVAAAK